MTDDECDLHVRKELTVELTETKTIQVNCDLRWLIERVATESRVMNTAVEMGLLSLLDTVAARSAAIDDPEAIRVLRVLCLDDGREQ